jgi:hypothetical protein
MQIVLMADPSYLDLLSGDVSLNDVGLSWGETEHTETQQMNISGDRETNPAVRANSKKGKKLKGKTVKGKNFSSHEDLVLCDAYLQISQDPIVGTEQRGGCYWKRVHDYFHAHLGEESDRNQNSIQHRWAFINEHVSKLCAAFAQIENRNKSGYTEVDKVQILVFV